MDKERIEGLIRYLYHVQSRPAMYIHDEPLLAFWRGFFVACAAIGVDAGYEGDIFVEHGWKFGVPLIEQMREQGMSSEAITNEFMTIVIETMKKRYGIEVDSWQS